MQKNVQNVIFFYDGMPNNYIKVCLQSLRKYNSSCNIFFFYRNPFIKICYRKYKVNFVKIDKKKSKNKLLFYKIFSVNKICQMLNQNDKLLVFDVDLLFQGDPFKLFEEFPNYDIYYTHSILSKPDSLRKKYIWDSVKSKVNGGVWGLRISKLSKELMSFWIKCEKDNYWKVWDQFYLRKEHLIDGITDLNWFFDQDFLNCIDLNEVPLSQKLKKVDIGYKYNYFTSTWGFFNVDLNMGNKIGNYDYPIIHFKGNFKDVYNLKNSRIYNLKNILQNKDLTTISSRENIYKKFMSRGEKRFEII
tara:strand:- start:242 stop:1150 length:909 start_codon:yes stop_codon:yes gene_type:complete